MVTTRSGRPYGSDGDPAPISDNNIHDTGQDIVGQGGGTVESQGYGVGSAAESDSLAHAPVTEPPVVDTQSHGEVQPVEEPDSALPNWLLQGGTLRERVRNQQNNTNALGGEEVRQMASPSLGRPPLSDISNNVRRTASPVTIAVSPGGEAFRPSLGNLRAVAVRQGGTVILRSGSGTIRAPPGRVANRTPSPTGQSSSSASTVRSKGRTLLELEMRKRRADARAAQLESQAIEAEMKVLRATSDDELSQCSFEDEVEDDELSQCSFEDV